MLADFYIPRISNDMKMAIQKINLWGQILYSLDHSKKVWTILQKRVYAIFPVNFVLFSIFPNWKIWKIH